MAEYTPTKFSGPNQTVVGQAALLLELLAEQPFSVGQLYLRFRDRTNNSYEAFALALTFLYAAGALEFDDQIVRIP